MYGRWRQGLEGKGRNGHPPESSPRLMKLPTSLRRSPSPRSLFYSTTATFTPTFISPLPFPTSSTSKVMSSQTPPKLQSLSPEHQALLPKVSRVLDKDHGPLCWIDCEMTGLDLATDRLIEVSRLLAISIVPIESDCRFIPFLDPPLFPFWDNIYPLVHHDILSTYNWHHQISFPSSNPNSPSIPPPDRLHRDRRST